MCKMEKKEDAIENRMKSQHPPKKETTKKEYRKFSPVSQPKIPVEGSAL